MIFLVVTHVVVFAVAVVVLAVKVKRKTLTRRVAIGITPVYVGISLVILLSGINIQSSWQISLALMLVGVGLMAPLTLRRINQR